jgi:Tol biopolymer transport system component
MISGIKEDRKDIMKSLNCLLIISIVLSYVFVAAADAIASKITLVTKETPLVTFEKGKPIRADAIVSPDNRRIVYREYKSPSGGRVMVNGEPSKRYDTFSGMEPIFSPDGKRLAYVAGTKDQKMFVVLDGNEGIGGYTGIHPVFSPDSSQLAYKAWDNDAMKEVVFLNGEKIGECRGIVKRSGVDSGLVFSPDGKRLAYLAFTDDGKYFVVVNGKEGKYYDARIDGKYYDAIIESQGVVFSQDSQHIVYTVKRGKTGVIVRDETEIAESNNLKFAVCSPDCNRIAYISKEAGGKRVTVDGNQGKLYASITGLKFSPNGKRFAYAAWYDDSMCVVVDGIEQKSYRWVMNITFSPDSNRMAYSAGLKGEQNECCTVVDGVEGKSYSNKSWEELPEGISPPVFSLDSKYVGYVVVMGNKSWMVVNEAEGKHYDELRKETIGGRNYKWDKSFVFSPDGKIAYWAKQGDKWMVVVEGVEGKGYRGYPVDGRLVFENPNLLSFVAFRDMTMFRVEIEIK